MVRFQVLRKIDELFAAVLVRRDEVGVLDDPGERQVVVGDVEPVDVGQGLLELQQRDDGRLVLQAAEFLAIRLGEIGNQPRQDR